MGEEACDGAASFASTANAVLQSCISKHDGKDAGCRGGSYRPSLIFQMWSCIHTTCISLKIDNCFRASQESAKAFLYFEYL